MSGALENIEVFNIDNYSKLIQEYDLSLRWESILDQYHNLNNIGLDLLEDLPEEHKNSLAFDFYNLLVDDECFILHDIDVPFYFIYRFVIVDQVKIFLPRCFDILTPYNFQQIYIDIIDDLSSLLKLSEKGQILLSNYRNICLHMTTNFYDYFIDRCIDKYRQFLISLLEF